MEDEAAGPCVAELSSGGVESSVVPKVAVLGGDPGEVHGLEVTSGAVVGARGEVGLVVVVVGVPGEA